MRCLVEMDGGGGGGQMGEWGDSYVKERCLWYQFRPQKKLVLRLLFIESL